MPSWMAAALSLGPAVTAIVAVEAVRVVATAGGHVAGRTLGALAEVTSSGVRQLALSGLVVAVSVLALYNARRRRLRWISWIALIALSALQLLLVWDVAIQAPHLARQYILRQAFSGAAAGHALLSLWLAFPNAAPRFRRAVGAVVSLGALAVGFGHYSFGVGLYPTLHTSAAILAFLGVHLGLALWLTGGPLTVRRVTALVAVPALVLTAGVVTPEPATARPHAAAYSALVRPQVIAETPSTLLRPDSPPASRPATGPIRPDDQALERFARHSGLPPLPEGFELADHDVLLVFIDALRFDRTTLADSELPTTPELARLARSGASYSFSRAFSPSNGTYPTMSSLLSMTLPSMARHELHARHWHGRLRPEQRTAAEALSEAGFHTFWVGNNFKRVMSIRVHGLWQGFDRRHNELIWPGRDLDADARIASRAIREIRAARATGRPYFGVVFFCSPHDDYQVHFPRWPADSPRDRYDQEVRYADVQLGRLLEEVDRGGGRERTLVIVTGDHGEAFGEHRHHYHLSSLYDEQTHVPLVIRVPGSEGRVVERTTSTLWVLPWLLLRGPVPARQAADEVLRQDLGPLLRETEGAVVSEFISRQRQEAALRWDDVTVYYDLLADFFRVFDARRDPTEQRDLREERPDLVERLTPRVQAYRRFRLRGQRYFFAPPESWPEEDQ